MDLLSFKDGSFEALVLKIVSTLWRFPESWEWQNQIRAYFRRFSKIWTHYLATFGTSVTVSRTMSQELALPDSSQCGSIVLDGFLVMVKLFPTSKSSHFRNSWRISYRFIRRYRPYEFYSRA